MEEVYSAVDFDVLLFDHVANKEPKLLAKMYSAKERLELEKKRVSYLVFSDEDQYFLYLFWLP